MSESLQEIGTRHGTDNATKHRYFERLEPYLAHRRNDSVHILEFGVGSGASARTWLEYFRYARVVGIDLFPTSPVTDERFTYGQSDQSQDDIVKRMRGLFFDLVFDDGAHHTKGALNAFNQLFPHCLAPGGLYVIVDLHAYWDPAINAPFEYNLFDFLQSQVHILMDHGKGQTGNSADGSFINFIHFWKSMVVICRK